MKFLAVFIVAGCFALPAHAQGVQQTRAALYAEIAAQLASGQSPPITASQLRTVLNDLLASTSAIYQDTFVNLSTAGLVVGNAAGGNQGEGSVNVRTAYYVNGVPLTGTGTVTSVTCGTGLTGGTITATGTCAIDIATNGNVWGGTTAKIIDTHVAQTSIAPVALVISTSTFTPNFASAINQEITMVHGSCSCTIANPTGVYAGVSGYLTIIQSSSGSDVATWGANWKFAGGVAPVLSTTANAVDTFGFYCRTTTFCEVTTSGLAFQ